MKDKDESKAQLRKELAKLEKLEAERKQAEELQLSIKDISLPHEIIQKWQSIEIKAESKLGKGSVFTFALPLKYKGENHEKDSGS